MSSPGSAPSSALAGLRWALLEGRDHAEIGAVELVAEGPCAVSLSRGGSAKTYSHAEPNEDACLFAMGPGGALIAVADGHHGAMGSKIAVSHLLENYAQHWTGTAEIDPDALGDEGTKALDDITAAIMAEGERCALPASPTTLSFALVRPGQDLLFHGSVGDSHIFATRGESPADLAWAAQSGDRPTYLGRPPIPEPDAKRLLRFETLRGLRALVLVTDGFSESGIGHADPEAELHAVQLKSLAESFDLRAVETCRGVADSAIGIQRKNRSGDNIACAVWVPWDSA